MKIRWPGGEDTLFTGFKPDIDPGYADFQMELDRTYQIEVLNLEMAGTIPEIINNLDNEACPTLPETVTPSWEVIIQQGAN